MGVGGGGGGCLGGTHFGSSLFMSFPGILEQENRGTKETTEVGEDHKIITSSTIFLSFEREGESFKDKIDANSFRNTF